MPGGTHLRSKSRALRLTAATLGAGATLFATAGLGTAIADDGDQPPVTGVPSTSDIIGSLTGTFGPDDTPLTEQAVKIITLRLDGSDQDLIAYCVDIQTQLAAGEPYVEGDWDTANPQSDMPHIQWVLEHSFPLIDSADVLAEAGIDQVPPDADQIVYLATQAAIWHFSDDFTLESASRANDIILAVNDYLTGPDNDGSEQPPPELTIDPTSATGEVGEPIGPFTVSTTADQIGLTTSAGTIVNNDGDEIDTVANGDQFNVVLDEPGDATIDASGTGLVPAGRIFILADQPQPFAPDDGEVSTKASPNEAQKLVLATPSEVEVSVSVSATATPAPTTVPSTAPPARPPLANTGASPWPKIGIGVGLLAVGTGLVFAARTRRVNRGNA